MSKIVIKNLEMYKELSQQESVNITGGDAISDHYAYLNSQLGPYNYNAHQVGAYYGNYWAGVLDNAANYGSPGDFSEILYGQVIPSVFYGNW
ncbi:MAG: hypothetical protein Tsb0014_29490 [Pleurocapsa sp.]